MGFESGSYEAYCLNQAVAYFGNWVDSELDTVSHKPSKDERKANEARQRRLDQILKPDAKNDPSSFADPSAFFN